LKTSSESRIKTKANSHVMFCFVSKFSGLRPLDLKAHGSFKELDHGIGRPIFRPSKFISASTASLLKPVGNTGRRGPSPFAILYAHVLEDSASRVHCLAVKSRSGLELSRLLCLMRWVHSFAVEHSNDLEAGCNQWVSVRDDAAKESALWILVM
jgi:hypothetical protein